MPVAAGVWQACKNQKQNTRSEYNLAGCEVNGEREKERKKERDKETRDFLRGTHPRGRERPTLVLTVPNPDSWRADGVNFVSPAPK